ncbi:MAG: methyltransferase [Alphaproteobacteria bacterium]
MKTIAALAAGVLALALAGCTTMQSYQAAITDPARPEADVKRDADRKPMEMLAIAEIMPGDKVVDLIPGGGYFTRIFARAVGPDGTVYAYQPSELDSLYKRPIPILAVAADPAYTRSQAPPSADRRLQIARTRRSRVDLHRELSRHVPEVFCPVDVAKLNKEIYAALKPGGLYVVLDHSAREGSGLTDTDKLHRIDEAKVRADLEAAGFEFVGESNTLRNPNDPRTANVFDPGIRGHTDQFILKFRRPR